MSTKKNKKVIKLNNEQVEELKTLCVAIRYAETAKRIRARFKAFMEDNEETLKNGVEIAGLKLGIHYQKQLIVEEA